MVIENHFPPLSQVACHCLRAIALTGSSGRISSTRVELFLAVASRGKTVLDIKNWLFCIFNIKLNSIIISSCRNKVRRFDTRWIFSRIAIPDCCSSTKWMYLNFLESNFLLFFLNLCPRKNVVPYTFWVIYIKSIPDRFDLTLKYHPWFRWCWVYAPPG